MHVDLFIVVLLIIVVPFGIWTFWLVNKEARERERKEAERRQLSQPPDGA